MTPPLVRLNKLSFLLREGGQADLEFSPSFSFIYGASNTGKSFAVKAIDFMLGGSRELPGIPERRPYDKIILELQIGPKEINQLERAMVGNDFRLTAPDKTVRVLGARHSSHSDENLSNFLLGRLGSAGKEVAKDKAGTKRSLSFRDIARFCITDETSIQSEASPVESGDFMLAPAERNVFKYLLTGEDDAALITQVKRTEFQVGRKAQIRLLEDMISTIDTELNEDFPDKDELQDKLEDIEAALKSLEAEIGASHRSIRALLDTKRRLISEIGSDQKRINDVAVSLENFDQLQSVYVSDIQRLEGLEEAGFLLGIDAQKACPVCGAPPAAQTHEHGLGEIERARAAAEAEIAKIKLHQSELKSTVKGTTEELERTGQRLAANRAALDELEKQLKAAAPNAEEQQKQFAEIIPKRDRINRGRALLGRRVELEKQKAKLDKAKQTRTKTNFQSGLSTSTAQDFADEVAKVLTEWEFPGERKVFFDMDSYDLIIDGKHRRDNGKGVRAITHAAFKVALLTYCRSRKLPHPGFLVLDTPLITYRDPISSRHGALTPDEQALQRTDMKERLCKHLGSLGAVGQIILFDNVDPPKDIARYAKVEIFTKQPGEGRPGLL